MPTSTLAFQVGHGTFALMPIFNLIEAHVFAAEPSWRRHGNPRVGKEQMHNRPYLDVCAPRSVIRRRRAAGGGLLCLERPTR